MPSPVRVLQQRDDFGRHWITAKGLRLGYPARKLYVMYSPRRFTGAWTWLLSRRYPACASGVTWSAGDTIPLGRRTLRVVAVRDDDADQPPALVVEEVEIDAA